MSADSSSVADAASSSSASTSFAGHICSSPGCGKSASQQCPVCVQLKLAPTFFCSKDCFTKEWKTHNNIHKAEKDRLNFRPPPYDYSGPLRPHYVTPMREVPAHIQRPDYALTGLPKSEMELRGSQTIHINNEKEVKGIRAACKLGREILDYAHSLVKPGITTEEIDRLVHEATIARGAYPSPLNYNHFPKSCCTSVNEVICHGIPDARPLQEGDIVNLDISVFYKGFHGDLNETYPVGKVDDASKKLIQTTYDSMMNAIQAVRPGAYCRDFGEIISKHVGKAGYSVVRSYCGHGIGALFHSTPNIPHYARNKAVGVLKPGMVFSIEPMINAGSWHDQLWPDDWTSTTTDGKRSAQFEHTVLVTDTGFEVLTARTKDSPAFFWETSKEDEQKSAQEQKTAVSPDANGTENHENGTTEKKKKKKKKKNKNKNAAADAEEQDDETNDDTETQPNGADK